MDTRPVFALITSKKCPACHSFKNRVWKALKTDLLRTGKVQVIEVEVPDNQSKPDPQKYHKDLARFIGWFPTMSLHPADKWYSKSEDLIGIIKNGRIVPPTSDKPEHIEMVSKMNLSKEDILKWVDYTLTNDRIFTRQDSNRAMSYQPSATTEGDNIMITDNGKVLNGQYSNSGRIKIPTAAYFKHSRVK